MSGKAEEVAIHLDTTKLCSETQGSTGVDYLFAEMDKINEKDSTQRFYSRVKAFMRFNRPDSMSMNKYISEFEHRHRALLQLRPAKDHLFDDDILAAMLLDQGNFNEEDQKLLRSTVADPTYDKMVAQLKRTFSNGDTSSSGSSTSTTSVGSSGTGKSYSYSPCPSPQIKEEPCFFQNEMPYCGQGGSPDQYTNESYNEEEVSIPNHLQENSTECQSDDCAEDIVYFNGSYYQRMNRGRQRNNQKSSYDQQHRSAYNHPYTGNQRQYPGKNNNTYRGNSFNNRGSFKQNTQFDNSKNFQPKKRCLICHEEDHLLKDCKYNTFTDNSKMTFFKSDFEGLDDEVTFLLGESTNRALLDTGASSTVCGKTWFKIYEDSLNEDEKSEIVTESSYKTFRFGDGGAVIADEKKTIPIKLCGKEVNLQVHIVENDVPLLLSSDTMKKMRLIINYDIDKVFMGDGQADLQRTMSGHIVIPIGRCSKDLSTVADNVTNDVFVIDQNDSKKTALHLHRYYAHSSSHKLKKFIDTLDLINKKGIIDELQHLDKSCDFCLKYKSKEKPHRKVAIPQGSVFNELVAMDLKMLTCGLWILHIIDTVTRFSIATPVNNKTADEILTKVFMKWIAIFGRPLEFMTDNGGEFVNDKFNDMCALLNVTVRTSPAESPWCNGTVERHNAILGDMIEAVLEETGCNLEIATAWACNAKNSLNNVFGFTPYQLVMGRIPYVPGILEYKDLPALNDKSSSKIVADHLCAMEEARKEFIRLQNSDRFRRILRERVQEGTSIKYVSGDVVYYKRQNEKKMWKGPATVVGQVDNQVLVKHGGMLVRIHPCRLVLKQDANNSITKMTSNNQTQSQRLSPIKENLGAQQIIDDDSDSSSCSDEEFVETTQQNHQQSNQVPIENNDKAEDQEDNNYDTQRDQCIEENAVLAVPDNLSESNENEWCTISKPETKTKISLKKDDIIRYRNSEEQEWTNGLIINRAGKVGGKYENNFNVRANKSDESITVVNLKDYHVEKLDEDKCSSNEEVLFIEDNESADIILLNSKMIQENPKITQAKQEELQKFKEFGTYEEVKDIMQPTVSTRWIVTEIVENKKPKLLSKVDQTQPMLEGKIKARLVARGFEEMNDQNSTSPTVTKTGKRLCLSIAISMGWTLHSLDITSAFLQSVEIERDIYIKPPADCKTSGIIWKLKKPLYGLNESSRLWYKTIKDYLISVGCQVAHLDKGLFSYYLNNKLQGIVCIHVDDLLYAGSSNFIKNIIQSTMKKFKISKVGFKVFKYLGWNITQEEDHVFVDQKDYSKGIKPINLPCDKSTSESVLLSKEEKKAYQGLLGQLLWISSQTRPDLSYDVLEHSTSSSNPTVKNVQSINKVCKRIQEGPQLLNFKAMNLEKDQISIVFFSDASLGNMPNKLDSARGFFIFLSNGNVFNPISWGSSKIKRVVHSIMTGETFACNAAVAEAIYVREILSEILYRNPRSNIIPIYGFIDSKQLSDSLKSDSQCQDRRVRLDIAELKEAISNGDVQNIHWVPTADQLADCLTKKGVNPAKLWSVLKTNYIPNIAHMIPTNKRF